MAEFALWRRLDTPGHDAAQLSQTSTGWTLHGTAVFLHDGEPASIGYTVDLDSEWRTVRGCIEGFLSARRFDRTIFRDEEGWSIDGRRVQGLSHLVDLDFGFTPATNQQQLRRLALEPGEATDAPAAWLDAGAQTLVELPQRYERRDERSYWYEAPSVGYEAILEIAENGFIARYPQLWEMEGMPT